MMCQSEFNCSFTANRRINKIHAQGVEKSAATVNHVQQHITCCSTVSDDHLLWVDICLFVFERFHFGDLKSCLKIGNLVTTSVGIIDGWSAINYVDLKNENSTYATGPLNDEQLGRMMLFSAIGGLFGKMNWF